MSQLRRLALAVLVCALALVAGNVSAGTARAAETRVWGFWLSGGVCVGVTGNESLGKHRGSELAAYDFASGYALAAEGLVASDAINAPRLANQLVHAEASSAFTAAGELSPEAIQGAKQIIAPGQLGNPAIPSGFGKYTTETFASPSGPFQVHFYMNHSNGAIYYGMDYKAVFNNGVQPFRAFSGTAP